MRRAALGLALALTLPAAAAAQAPLAAQGCLGCHGAGGAGSAAIPGLSGRPAAELSAAMCAFVACLDGGCPAPWDGHGQGLHGHRHGQWCDLTRA